MIVSFFILVLFVDHIKLIDNQPVFAKQTTQLLDRLLLNYNKYSRPNPSNESTKVHISIQIKDVLHNRNEMMFTLQCVLNQWWLDSRLSVWNYFETLKKNHTYLPFDLLELTHKLATIKLPNDFHLWTPDTFILNGKPTIRNSYSNKRLIRLHLDGTVLLSTRFMFQFKCKMDKEIAYRWIHKNPCTLSPKLELSQLNLIKLICVNKTRKLSPIWVNSKKYRSTIGLDLYFKRNTDIYFIELYLPCIVLVMTSFTSFFINREATNVRILIGSMTTLSMIILSIENRLLVKNVPYYTAIDYFVTISFLFILASILEYIFVHSNTKIAYGDIGTFSNWIPIDRIAKLFYSALQPKEQILNRPLVRTQSTALSKDEQLAAVVRSRKEPMIYDLPVTDLNNLKDEQTVLMNNLILNNQLSLINHSNTLSLRRSTNELIDQLATNYSTFPRTNHHHHQSVDDSFGGSTTIQLNDSLIALDLNATLMDTTNKTLKRRLASIPEETLIQNTLQTIQINQQIEQEELVNQQMNDNLKLLRQQQEDQLESEQEQQNYQFEQLRNAVFELERSQNLTECENILDNSTDDDDDENRMNGNKNDNSKGNRIGNKLENKLGNKVGNKVGNKIGNKVGHRLNAKINAKRLNSHNIIGQLYYEFLASLLSCYNPKLNNQNDSINQLNSISRIDQVCRLMFPVLYLLFIFFYYLLLVI